MKVEIDITDINLDEAFGYLRSRLLGVLAGLDKPTARDEIIRRVLVAANYDFDKKG